MDVTAEHINLFLTKSRNANWAGVFYLSPFKTNFDFLLQDLNQISSGLEDQFIFHPFDQAVAPSLVLKPQYKNEQALHQLLSLVESGIYWELNEIKGLQETTKEEYTENFKAFKSDIKSGHCSKAVLSTLLKKTIPEGFDPGAFLFRLKDAYPQAYIYLFSSPLSGTWIGATPETLINWSKDKVITMSLAGTRNKSEEVFSFGAKEKKEQAIVTSYIEDIFLNEFGNVEMNQPVEFNYGEMIHLITRISAKTNSDFGIDKLIKLAQRMHPTPAVGGWSKESARSLIRNFERHPRFYYSGYLGTTSPNQAELAVNLRCITLTADALYAFAGGGITIDSDLEAEWAETRLKAQALIKFL